MLEEVISRDIKYHGISQFYTARGLVTCLPKSDKRVDVIISSTSKRGSEEIARYENKRTDEVETLVGYND